jgi:chromate transporter
MALPSFCIIFLISLFLDRFLEIRWIANAFRGIKLAVGILILDAAIRMIRRMPKKPFAVAIAVCAFAAMMLISIFSVRITSITLMLAAALIGLIVFLIAKRKEGDA